MTEDYTPEWKKRLQQISLDDVFSPTYVYALVSGIKGIFFAWEFTEGNSGHFWSIVVQLVMIEQSLILAILRAKKSEDLAQKRSYMLVWTLMALFVGFGWFYQVQYLVQQTTGIQIPEQFIQFYLSTLSVFAAILGYILLEGIKIFGNSGQRERWKRDMFAHRAATVRAETEWQRANAAFRITRAEMFAGRIAGFWLLFWIFGKMFGAEQRRALKKGVQKSYRVAFGQLHETQPPALFPVETLPTPSGDSMGTMSETTEPALSLPKQVNKCLNPTCSNEVPLPDKLTCKGDDHRKCEAFVQRAIKKVVLGKASGQDWDLYEQACERNEARVRTLSDRFTTKVHAEQTKRRLI
ncbi:MAG: hypothetical protein JNN12_11515 [Bacteroidetes Order II. Incertae sedis bacterium]|nr:hypothetical protein [Bacteroidetes Order II. bacterium]